MTKTEVDNSIYDLYGDKWYTAYDDPVALLRAESKVKTPWVIEKIKKHFDNISELELLDVGCGGGFLSNELAENGFKVTGVDLSPESLVVAARYDKTKSVKYLTADAYNLPFADSSFDVITAMDFLEHVEDPSSVIKEFSRKLKPNGLFIFHTFNRNFIAGLVIIKAVELLVKNTPKNLHVLRLFIKPEELTQYCEQSGLSVLKMTGIKPVFSSIPIKNVFTGVVPKELKFELTSSLKLSYMGYAIKSLKPS
ncbi:MAG: bifunctional 2-polyprenyl-6-hydroxyphenol methylase/3-demethylubiquinol 3-O-methyltransferase UbiG [Pseudobdellovibrio sp.]